MTERYQDSFRSLDLPDGAPNADLIFELKAAATLSNRGVFIAASDCKPASDGKDPGRGLFAGRDFEDGSVVGLFMGYLMWARTFKGQKSHGRKAGEGWVIDGWAWAQIIEQPDVAELEQQRRLPVTNRKHLLPLHSAGTLLSPFNTGPPSVAFPLVFCPPASNS
jgi:hypothetical protein